MGLGLLGLIIMGAIVGFLADLIDKKHSNSWWVNILLGMVGALVGSLLRGLLTNNDNLAFDFWSFIWALAGTLIVLAAYHAVRPKLDRNNRV